MSEAKNYIVPLKIGPVMFTILGRQDVQDNNN